MEFDLSISQINDLLAHVGKETKLAKRLSSHGLTNGRILVPDHIFDDDSLEQLWNIAKKTNDKSLYFQLVARNNVEREKVQCPSCSLH
ncbi:hypothetical protein [Oxalobacter aliiformigenes]|uniref:hypothetical protein n=1 Tax=Oxalobacter aliiformigenes TaxID=2946593 RepID=UPI002FCDE0F7